MLMNLKSSVLFTLALTTILLRAAPGDDIARNAAELLKKQKLIYAEQQAEQQRVAEAQAEIQKIYSNDPWRAINGSTNSTREAGWLEFQGSPQGVRNGGVIFEGSFGKVGTLPKPFTFHPRPYGADFFFVENFPYPVGGGKSFYGLVAHYEGFFSYTNSEGQAITIKKFNYGTPCTKTWSPEEIAAAKQKADSKKQAIQDRVLKSNQDSAARGEPLGLMHMGERYRDGDGVEKNLLKAKTYFQKAADAGVQEAADELSKLNP